MPEDSTRRLLKAFGVAVTELEDALAAGKHEEAQQAAAALARHGAEIRALVDRLLERASGGG
jgi:hypothetical protein